jgi:hypothetical protein
MNIGRARRTCGRLSRSGLVTVARRRHLPDRPRTAGIVRRSADYVPSTARARGGWDLKSSVILSGAKEPCLDDTGAQYFRITPTTTPWIRTSRS